MTVNLAKYNSGRHTANLDIRLINFGGNVIVALRDDCKAFNPLEYTPEESEDYKIDK